MVWSVGGLATSQPRLPAIIMGMRKTLQELGIHDFFHHKRGTNNAITDVAGVRVGHTTVIEGTEVRTGVTVIMPGNPKDGRYRAGGFAFNANGEMTGLQYILEEARLIGPISLTNTISLGDVYSAMVEYYKGEVALPIVGECWDGFLNDIWGKHVTKEHVFAAIESASGGAVEQGSVGAGTGMTSFGFKAGIGTASRRLELLGKTYTVGVLVNNNMSREDGRHRYMRIAGVDVAKALGEYDEVWKQAGVETHQSSSILAIATDVPLHHYQLNRMAKHAVLGFGRTGLVSYTGSGDFVLAFSTGNILPLRETKVTYQTEGLEESLLDDVFEALLESVEEAYLNSILTADEMVGVDGHVARAFPVAKLLKKLA